MGLNGAGFFGTIKNPRVIWLGLKGDVDRMGALRNSLQKALGPFGIKEENRPFRPHITLGRFKQDAAGGEELRRIMDSYKNITSPMCVMSELVLYRSELRPSGPVYTVLRRYRFTGQL
jgi:2'-5' RNA ligase